MTTRTTPSTLEHREWVADGKDSDCDGYEICYTDVDGDGFRPPSGATTASSDMFCDGIGEAMPSAPATDCDDFSSAVRPDAAEVVGDGIDSNCDGMELCYVDVDGDGYAASDATVESDDAFCTGPGEATSDLPGPTAMTLGGHQSWRHRGRRRRRG